MLELNGNDFSICLAYRERSMYPYEHMGINAGELEVVVRHLPSRHALSQCTYGKESLGTDSALPAGKGEHSL